MTPAFHNIQSQCFNQKLFTFVDTHSDMFHYIAFSLPSLVTWIRNIQDFSTRLFTFLGTILTLNWMKCFTSIFLKMVSRKIKRWQHEVTNVISLHFFSGPWPNKTFLRFINDCLRKYVVLFKSAEPLPHLLWTWTLEHPNISVDSQYQI